MKPLEAFYHDLHEHPELSMKETRTAAKVAEEFRRLGLETLDNVGGGVIGILKNGEGPVTLVRSELDALPVEEDTGVSYKSQNPGVMHACAHDLHTTALIGTIESMIHLKDAWKGTLVFVAQPGEEVIKGADSMIRAGIFKKIPKPDQCVALHTKGALEMGKVGYTSGPALATSDSLDVTIRGRGTHATTPHLGIDPIVVASEFVIKMQTLAGREVDPIEPVIITVGSIHGGTKNNIIPDEVKIQMTVRTFNLKVREMLLKRIDQIAKGLATTAGAPEPTVTLVESAPMTVNDPKLAAKFSELMAASLGKEKVVEIKPILGSEDFGEFGFEAGVPSFFYFVGAQMKAKNGGTNHSPRFAPDFDRVAPLAIQSMVAGLLGLHQKLP